MYERVHKSLAVAKPRRMIWAGTVQPADDPGPSTSDEVALVSSVFDFADANHVELHGNILIAEGLMRQLCPYDTEKHATLAQRARSLRRDVSIMQTPASGGTVTRGVLKIPWGGARIKAPPPSETQVNIIL